MRLGGLAWRTARHESIVPSLEPRQHAAPKSLNIRAMLTDGPL